MALSSLYNHIGYPDHANNLSFLLIKKYVRDKVFFPENPTQLRQFFMVWARPPEFPLTENLRGACRIVKSVQRYRHSKDYHISALSDRRAFTLSSVAILKS